MRENEEEREELKASHLKTLLMKMMIPLHSDARDLYTAQSHEKLQKSMK